MPLDKIKILNIINEQKPFLRKNFFVTEIGLFGSFARNEANENSDIDFLVKIDAPLEIYTETKEALRNYLNNLFNKEIDLANPQSLKPHFKERILKQTIYA